MRFRSPQTPYLKLDAALLVKEGLGFRVKLDAVLFVKEQYVPREGYDEAVTLSMGVDEGLLARRRNCTSHRFTSHLAQQTDSIVVFLKQAKHGSAGYVQANIQSFP